MQPTESAGKQLSDEKGGEICNRRKGQENKYPRKSVGKHVTDRKGGETSIQEKARENM